MISSYISKHKGYAKTEAMNTMGSSYSFHHTPTMITTTTSDEEIGKPTTHNGNNGSNSSRADRQNNKKKNPFCPILINNRKALVVWTRVIFGVTVLTCTAVILVSIWLMLDCRDKLRPMRGVLEHNTKYCTNMGLQVLFACCVVLFAVFGLGCIGRRLTGYAMLIISGVAIFQSTMTLVFNECQTGVKDDFLTTTASGFKDCRLGSRNPPFQLAKMKSSLSSKSIDSSSHSSLNRAQSSSLKDKAKRSTQVREKRSGRYSDLNDPQRRKPKINPDKSQGNKESRTSFKRYKKDDDDFIDQMLDEITMPGGQNSLRSGFKLSCDKDSAYVTILERFLPGKDVTKCLILCEIYKNVCSAESSQQSFHDSNAIHSGGSVNQGRSTQKFNHKSNGINNQTGKNPNYEHGNNGKYSSDDQDSESLFEQTTKTCSIKMWDKIRKFCFYDNVVFMPLSLVGPLFYILLSLSFMYLGHCDTHLAKQDDNEGSQRGKTPELDREEGAIEPFPRTRSVSFLSRLLGGGRDSDSTSSTVTQRDILRAAGISGAVSTPQLNVVLSEKTCLGLAADGRRSRYYPHYGNITTATEKPPPAVAAASAVRNASTATTNAKTNTAANSSNCAAHPSPSSKVYNITDEDSNVEGCALLQPPQPQPPPPLPPSPSPSLSLPQHLRSNTNPLPAPSTSPSYLSLPSSSISSCSTVERYLITSD